MYVIVFVPFAVVYVLQQALNNVAALTETYVTHYAIRCRLTNRKVQHRIHFIIPLHAPPKGELPG